MMVRREDIVAEAVNQQVNRRVMAYDSQLMLVEMEMKKGGVGALHTHPHHQVDYLVSGLVEFEMNGEKQTLRPGDSVLIPPEVEHGAVALEDSILLDIFSPMREDFLQGAEKG